MSDVIDLQQFLVGRSFLIPPYQRNYAWTTRQVEDLFDDVQEALDTNSRHYLGTIVLAQGDGQAYEMVDGQQRLTTLTLIIHALLEELAPSDPDRIANEAILLRQEQALKLNFGSGSAFVAALLAGQQPTPGNAGQRKLRDAYLFARERAKALTVKGGSDLVKQWLNMIKTLEILQFVEQNTGRAIRLFQTLNDRGLPLTTMDKAKALLMLYSNRYLGGSLDQKINYCFGQCFAAFDDMREFVRKSEYHIDNIARETFSEDDILRYHYLTYSHPDTVNCADYYGSIHIVFDGFLKESLKLLRTDPKKLQSFIDDYITDLSGFATAFSSLVIQATNDDRLYKLFVVLGLSARLYPLAIRLYQRNLLFAQVPGSTVDLLHCLEVCDVRVYKTRGTDPARDIGDLSHRSRSASINELGTGLQNFVMRFMPDGLFQTQLGQEMYHNGAVLLMLLAHDEQITGSPYPMTILIQMIINQIMVEHIFPQEPNFSVTSYGFVDDADYQDHLHMFGNLTLLSRSENSRCNNQSVHTKFTDPKLYAASAFASTRQLVHSYRANAGVFHKADVAARTKALASYVMSRWAIW